MSQEAKIPMKTSLQRFNLPVTVNPQQWNAELGHENQRISSAIPSSAELTEFIGSAWGAETLVLAAHTTDHSGEEQNTSTMTAVQLTGGNSPYAWGTNELLHYTKTIYWEPNSDLDDMHGRWGPKAFSSHG